MSGKARAGVNQLEREIEVALRPGRYVSDGACFSFVDSLGKVEQKVAQLVDIAPARARELYEAFLAGCLEKAEEVDDSSGSFGEYIADLTCGWVQATQAGGAAGADIATRLLAWIDTDEYGYFHDIEQHVAKVLDPDALAAFTDRIRARYDAADAGAGAHRTWARVLRPLYVAARDVDAYASLAEQSGLTVKDCHAVAVMLSERRQPEPALSWVERGLALGAQEPFGSSRDHELNELKAALLAALGRDGEALETAWAEYVRFPHRITYDHLFTFVPPAERPAWQDKAIDTAMAKGYFPYLVELLLHAGQTHRVRPLVAATSDDDLELLSHDPAERVATILVEGDAVGEAARVWRAQGMDILKGRTHRPKLALSCFEHAKRCYEQAGQVAQWEQVVAEVTEQHYRKAAFLDRFEALASGTPSPPRRREPSFLERAKERWAAPPPDQP